MGYHILRKLKHSFFKEVTVNYVVFKGDSEVPDIVFDIPYLQSFILINEGTNSTTDDVDYSFNGFDVHGKLKANLASSTITFDNRQVSRIWFRSPNGGSPLVAVHAWSK